MMPGARIQAAIELLGEIHSGSAPADRAIAGYLRARRYIGGGDRRDIIDRVYGVLRRRAALDWWIQPGGAANGVSERSRIVAGLILLDGWTSDQVAGSFDGGKYCPAPLDGAERQLVRALAGGAIAHPDQPDWVRLECPAWLEADLRDAFGAGFAREMSALAAEAALDLRVNSLKASRDLARSALSHEGIEAQPTQLSPLGLRVQARPALATLKAFRDGLIEVQDEGSQLVALLCDARPGMRVVDFCAGAGGKTLALAAAMKNKGHIVACDTLRGRVERAAVRLRRAAVHNVERRGLTSERDPWVKRHIGSFDRVLIDAPCSGVGIWRRNSEAKWRITPDQLADLVRLQRRILESAARLVKPGGRLIYATCSLLPSENANQISWFLGQQTEFTVMPISEVWTDTIGSAPGGGPCPSGDPLLQLTPAANGTDGFFMAVLARRAASPSS
ncbi:MAG: RsmB/NOP family class I SAM-dependent RNA methyltransferase [Dongiaceae bacterium]